jgi:hypothetical protein
MAGGYFDDGTVQVALGAHVFVTPGLRRNNLLLTPLCAPALALANGGGVLRLTVTGQALRQNLGDAERYAVELLRALATSGAGALGVEDGAGRRAVFASSVCTGAAAELRALRFAEISFDFACPEAPDDAGWAAMPDAPAVYEGTTSAQDYAAGGVPLGVGGTMRIEMERRSPVRPLPRARGARACGPASAACLRLIVTAHALCGPDNLAAALRDMERSIGATPVELTANGNIHAGVVLESVQSAHGDRAHTRFQAEFVQGISS